MNVIDKRSISKDKLRVCKICNVEQSLLDNFYYIVVSNCFNTTCKKCVNIGRKKKRKENSIAGKSICNIDEKQERKCKKCNKTFIIKDAFYYHKNNKCYLHTCKYCIQKERSNQRYKRNNNIEVKSNRIIPRKYSIKDKANILLRSYLSSDKSKGFINNLTAEDIITALHYSCTYCGFPSTGLDRKDNSKGHTLENTVPCCIECNLARKDIFSQEETLIIGDAIKYVKENRILENLLLKAVNSTIFIG